MERRRRRRLALVPVSYFQWPLLAVVALGPGPPGLLALGRDEHDCTSRQGLRLKSRRHWNSTHAIVSVNLTPEERKRRLMYPTTLSTYTRAGGAALGLGNSQQQHATARGGAGGPALSIGRASRIIITSLSVRCPRRPRERSSGAAWIRPHDAAGLSGPPRTPATSSPSPVWTPAGHVGRRRIAPGPRRNPASVYAGPVPARHVGDMASRGAVPPRRDKLAQKITPC